MRKHPAERPPTPPFHRQLIRDGVECGLSRRTRGWLTAVSERAEAPLPRRDRIGNGIAIAVAKKERIHERHRRGKRVAFVRRQPGRFEHALEVEPPERERGEADIETEQRAADMPRKPR